MVGVGSSQPARPPAVGFEAQVSPGNRASGPLPQPRRQERWLAFEPALILAAAPLLLFPWRWPEAAAIASLAIPLAWILRWRILGRPTRSTGCDAPLVYVLLATLAATIPVVDWRPALPRLLGVVVGVALFYAVANAAYTRRTYWLLCVGFLLASGATALAGLVGTEWPTGKLPWFDAVYARLPTLLGGLVEDSERGGFQPNQLAGVLSFPLLVGVSLLFTPWQLDRHGRPLRALLGLGVLVTFAVVVLTQSRSAYSGLAGGVVFLVIRYLLGLPVDRDGGIPLRAIATGLGLLVGMTAAGQLLVSSETRGAVLDAVWRLGTRVDLWAIGFRVVQDHPYLGVGIGQFNLIVHTVYDPKLFVSPPYTYAPHAHNAYLQTAIDLGVPGAIAVGLVTLAHFRNCRRLMACADPALRGLGAGLAAAMVGYLIFGLTDAINPGARAGLAIWATMGLAAGGRRLARETGDRRPETGDGGPGLAARLLSPVSRPPFVGGARGTGRRYRQRPAG